MLVCLQLGVAHCVHSVACRRALRRPPGPERICLWPVLIDDASNTGEEIQDVGQPISESGLVFQVHTACSQVVKHPRRPCPNVPGQRHAPRGTLMVLLHAITTVPPPARRSKVSLVSERSERIDALSVLVRMWPEEPASASGFANDIALFPQDSSFVLVRHQLLTSLRRLRNAAQLVQEDDGWGTHLLMLRPALVMVSKAAWVVRADQSPERVGRSLGVLLSDRRNGSRAMRKAVEQGAIAGFSDVATGFDRSAAELVTRVPVPEVKQPSDERLIQELGDDVDDYYGTKDAKSHLQLLWNASSCLAHGETWFPFLSGGLQRRRRFGEILTSQSFDVMCSAFNTTALRIVSLASSPPGAQVPPRSSPS